MQESGQLGNAVTAIDNGLNRLGETVGTMGGRTVQRAIQFLINRIGSRWSPESRSAVQRFLGDVLISDISVTVDLRRLSSPRITDAAGVQIDSRNLARESVTAIQQMRESARAVQDRSSNVTYTVNDLIQSTAQRLRTENVAMISIVQFAERARTLAQTENPDAITPDAETAITQLRGIMNTAGDTAPNFNFQVLNQLLQARTTATARTQFVTLINSRLDANSRWMIAESGNVLSLVRRPTTAPLAQQPPERTNPTA
jgi:hypothetical protein